MEKSKSFSDLRKDFLRCNKERRKKVALREGFSEPELYLQYLEKMRKSEIGAFREKARKATKSLKERPVVHLVDILDVSGSMSGSKIRNAIEGINNNLKDLSKDIDNTYTFVTFSNFVKRSYEMTRDIPKKVSETTYGSTALYDAIGQTLQFLKSKVKKYEKILVNIYTDGEENSSRNFTAKDIEEIISEMKDYCTVTFIGTENDVKKVTKDLSIDISNTLVYDGTGKGLADSLETTKISRQTFYSSVVKGEDVTKNFYKKLKED